MGHTDTKMIKLHYAPWVHSLDVAHIERVVERRRLKPHVPWGKIGGGNHATIQ
jgi:hypothetical protein